MRRSTQAERGYSLAEALVVVAIIGVISLVSVPNFMAMYRSGKIKAGIRLLSTDVRAARQRAVTTYRPTMVSLGTTATEKYSWFVYDWNGTAWVQRKEGVLEPETSVDNRVVYFTAIGFPDVEPAGALDGRPDIIFETNGGIRNPPADPTFKIRTDANIAKNEFVVSVSPAGSVKVQ
jgi:prepilin-type N-terminal cleavage/methylation domain-containing protein